MLLLACGGNEKTDGVISSVEALLKNNSSWPYAVEGVFDIVDAGGYEDTNYPGWAVGSLEVEGSTYGLGIDIGPGVVGKAKIDIDSGKKFRVWLGKPTKEYGDIIYPVEKIERI